MSCTLTNLVCVLDFMLLVGCKMAAVCVWGLTEWKRLIDWPNERPSRPSNFWAMGIRLHWNTIIIIKHV